MSLSSLAIAVQGVGFGPRMLAGQGFFPLPAAHETDEVSQANVIGGRRRRDDDLTVAEVDQQWELLDLRLRNQAADAAVRAEIENRSERQAPAERAALSDAASAAAPNEASAAALLSMPAGVPLTPDDAELARKAAQRKRNAEAILLLMMDL